MEIEQSYQNTSETSSEKKDLQSELEHCEKGLCVLQPIQEVWPVFDEKTYDHLHKQVYIIE